MKNQTDLLELTLGERVDHFLILNKIELRIAKNNKQYLNIELRDKSTAVAAKMWEGFENFKTSVNAGTIVKVTGLIEEFMGNRQIKIEKIRAALNSDNVKHEDFLPKSSRDLNEMENELNARIKKIENNYLKTLLDHLFDENTYNKYIRVPAGKAWHHAYIHGLIEHTLEIIKICELMCDFHAELNRDLLICGAILHDFGKIRELSFETSFDYTDEGKLLGHIVIAANEVGNTIDQVENFPEDLKNQLIHLILSHQGKLEFASPVEPKTLEAIALYHADELSAKTNAYKHAIKAESNSESKWTRFLPLADTSLYIPGKEKNKEDQIKTLFDK